MRKIIFLFLSLLFTGQIDAQISVESCSLLENDLDARNYPILDDEGSVCALVKIVTTAKGFNFEIGQLPVKKVEESKVGEIWVYVPDGTMKMKITHADLGSLRGSDVENGYYMFSQRLKRAKVYRMVLTHKEVIKMVGPQIPVKLTFNCDIEGAEVILGEGVNAKSQGVISNHQFSMTWPKGQSIVYKIKKDRYEDYDGTYKVENDENTVNIKLKPLFGNVSIKTLPNAVIKLNGREVGRGSYQDNIDLGSYNVVVSLSGYHDAQQSFTVSSGERKSLEVMPNMIYGSVKVSSNPSGADVYIDGNHKGTTPTTISNLTPGSHNLQLRKNRFANINKTINILGDQTITADASFTTKQSIQTLREHAQKNHFYVNASFIVGSLNAPSIGVGYYMPKVAGLLFELGGYYGNTKSDEIYWYNSEYDNIGKATYSPYGFYGSVGCAIKCGLKFHITPKAGIRYTGMKSNWDAVNSASDPATGSNAISATAGCMLSYTICPHFVLSLTPQYDLSVKESNGFNEVVKYCPSVKNSAKGLNCTLGLTCYF